MNEPVIRTARWHELDPRTLHDLIALRINIFVVEQDCPFAELDGRDVDPQTQHLWLADELGPTSYLRVLTQPDGSLRIGRVCTRADARGRGLSAALLRDVLARNPGRRLTLGAQERLAGWYARFGFVQDGERYLEDGIGHLPMRLTPVS